MLKIINGSLVAVKIILQAVNSEVSAEKHLSWIHLKLLVLKIVPRPKNRVKVLAEKGGNM